MATIGLRDLYRAPITVGEDGEETYGTPVRMAKAISAEMSVEVAEAILYADDGADEVVKEFVSGELTLNVNDLNIKHDALKSLIRKYISDPDCLWLLDMIIDSTEGNVGIPIGNQSSQIFALLYLSSLDHMVKEKLGIKFYGRYMDDFYLIHEDKEYLRYCWKEIEIHVNELGLSLNAKTNIYPLKNGIDFLGFHSYLTESGAVIRKVRRKSKNNARRRLTKMRGLLETGKITPEKVEQSYKSWRGHASKGNCYHLIRNMDQHYNKLFGQYAVAGNRGGVAVSEEKEEGKECRKS